jgi:hypothetical protein
MEYYLENYEYAKRKLQLQPQSVVWSTRESWHCCKPVKITDEMFRWCLVTYGNPGFSFLTFEVKWEVDRQRSLVMFGYQSDAELFMLRWS